MTHDSKNKNVHTVETTHFRILMFTVQHFQFQRQFFLSSSKCDLSAWQRELLPSSKPPAKSTILQACCDRPSRVTDHQGLMPNRFREPLSDRVLDWNRLRNDS